MVVAKITFSNSVALVTGAAGGIGSELVRGLLERRIRRVYCADLNPVTNNWSTGSRDERIVPLPLDITEERSIETVAKICTDVSLLINVAGYCAWQGFVEPFDIKDARREMEINFWGPAGLIRHLMPTLRKNQPSAIVNMVSFAAFVSLPMVGSYSASKSALKSYTECLGAELAGHGVHVMGVYPGPVDTAMNRYRKDGEPASPRLVAQRILDDLEKGEEYCFPDTWSADWATRYWDNPKDTQAMLRGNTASVD